MEPIDKAKEVLDTMLGYLGFVVDVQPLETENGTVLEIISEESDILIGRRGERLDDIQYLANRIVQTQMPDAPKVRVDAQHYRMMREDQLVEEAKAIAERVKASKRAVKLPPLNSYDRRLVHNAIANDPSVETWSPKDNSRMKRLIIRPARRKDEEG
ncbi:MAG: R3H domain-containing nucleic acid-binding protein [Verrucomicrobiota bacterium]